MEHQIELSYNDINIIMQCKTDEKLKDVFENFKLKVKAENKLLTYIYDGIAIQNENSTFNEIVNLEDKKRNKMNILVVEGEIPVLTHQDCIIESNNIVCPECKEDIKFNFEDYVINLFKY